MLVDFNHVWDFQETSFFRRTARSHHLLQCFSVNASRVAVLEFSCNAKPSLGGTAALLQSTRRHFVPLLCQFALHLDPANLISNVARFFRHFGCWMWGGWIRTKWDQAYELWIMNFSRWGAAPYGTDNRCNQFVNETASRRPNNQRNSAQQKIRYRVWFVILARNVLRISTTFMSNRLVNKTLNTFCRIDVRVVVAGERLNSECLNCFWAFADMTYVYDRYVHASILHPPKYCEIFYSNRGPVNVPFSSRPYSHGQLYKSTNITPVWKGSPRAAPLDSGWMFFVQTCTVLYCTVLYCTVGLT